MKKNMRKRNGKIYSVHIESSKKRKHSAWLCGDTLFLVFMLGTPFFEFLLQIKFFTMFTLIKMFF